jgi:phosphoadenosine phosphosulfate reductase
MQDISELKKLIAGKAAGDVIAGVVEHFGAERLAFASSLGAEDQVLTHMLRTAFPEVGIFTIDTGRLPQESYDLMQKTMEYYGFRYEVLFPDSQDVSRLVSEHGPNLFYKSVDLRKSCCNVRKVVPLQKKLATLDAWICGLRRGQAVTRGSVEPVEWDAANGLVKVNPLAAWSDALHDQGYPSIGCAPCTRAVKPGEDLRAGRWWWESPEHKECGLHQRGKRKD